MPNYDLGTARGRIRVDADTRGASNADRALKAFERTISALAGKLGSFEASMNRIESELNSATRDFEQAERAAGRFERQVSSTDGSVRDFADNVLELKGRLKGFQGAVEKISPPAIAMTRVFREFRKTGNDIGFVEQKLQRFLRSTEMGDVAANSFVNLFGRPQQNNIIRWGRALTRAGLVATVMSTLTGKITGTSAAMKTLTGGQSKLLRWSSTFRTVGFAAGVLGIAATRMDVLGRATRRLTTLLGPFNTLLPQSNRHLTAMGASMRNAGRWAVNLYRNMDQAAKGLTQFVGGMALARYGLSSLRRQFAFLGAMGPLIKTGIVAALYLIPAALQLGGKALQGFSNLLVGLVDGVKQLGGAFLAIPGGIALMITAFGSLKVITSGLKTLFEDVFKAKDAEEMKKAIDALPPSMQGIGKAIGEVLPKWKALSTDAAMTFAAGAEDQIRKLSEGYLPILSKGLGQNASAWRGAKDQLVDFLKQGQTMSDLNGLMNLSAQTINQLSGNIKPLMSGFRDLAMVGAQFLRDLSAGVPSITEKFAAWAKINRENGNLMKWMQEGWKGVKDLVNGLKDAGKATLTLLTLFKTNDGSNFLDRFAASMAKFNDTVQKSAASGLLKQIGDAVKNVGTDKISSLVDVLRSAGDALKEIIPFIVDVSKSFNTVMTPAIKLAMEIVEQFFKFLNDIGAGPALGVILGIVGAFKLITKVLAPIRSLLMVAFGGFTALKGAQNIVLGVAGALEKFGPAGRAASNGILGVGDAVAGAMSKFLLVGGVVAGFIMALNSANDKSREFDKTMQDSAQHQKEFSQSLKNSFMADNGLAGKTVFDTVTERVSQMRDDLDKQAQQMPTLMDHIKGFFLTGGGGTDLFKDNGKGGDARPTFWFSDPKYINDAQAAAAAGEKAEGAFKRLGFTNEDLSKIVSGSTTAFDKQVAAIRASGDGGNEAADQLQGMRNIYQGMLDDFAKAGPGAAKLASGIEAIAASAGDSEAKLNGMKTALEGLGLLQTNQYEAAFNYAEAIKGLGDAAANSAANLTKFDDILMPGTNTLNTSSQAAQQLFNTLQPIGEKFLNLASKGGDVTQMWQDMQPQLKQVADAFHLTEGQVQNLVGQLGVVPDSVKILVQLEGKDTLTQDLGAVYLSLQQSIGKGVEIPVIVQDAKSVEAEIDKVLGPVLDDYTTSSANNTMITIKPGLDPSALATIAQQLAAHGITLPGGPTPATPAQMPVAVPPPPPAPVTREYGPRTTGGDAPLPAAPAPPPPPQKLPELVPNPASVQALADANKQIADLKTALESLQNKPINIDTKGIDDIKNKIGELKTFLGANGNLEFTIIAKGYDETVAVMNRVKDSVTNLINEINKIPGATTTAFGQVITQLSNLAGQANTQGSAFVTAFAQGMSSNPAAVQAAQTMAQSIKDQFHNSPPKKGPLSQHGDQAKYAGGKFVDAYAAGLSGNYAVAGKAASGMASLVSGSMPSGSGGNSPFLGQLSQFLDFFDHLNSGFQQMVDLFSNAAKFISDPLGKGTFFGQSTGAAFGFTRDKSITDEDLAQRRADKAKDTASGMAGGPYPGDQALLANVPKGKYSQSGDADLAKGLADCSSSVEDLVNMMDGQPTGGRQMSTANAAQWLADHGFQQGKGQLGDMRVAYNSGHMQATLPGGTNFNWGSDAAAARGGVGGNMGADDPALTNQWYRKVADVAVAAVAADPTLHQGTGALPGPDTTQNTLDTIATNTGKTADVNADQLTALRQQDSVLNDAISSGQNPNSTDEQVASSLMTIQKSIDATNNNNTPQAKAQATALQGVQDSIKSDRGMTEGANPIDQITNAASSASNIASDVMGVLKSGIEAFGAANDLVQMGVRYPSNSEDVMKAIDDVQKFIEFGAKVAQTVGDIASTASSFTGGMDMGATAAVGQVASLVSGALTAINNAIDIGQEAYRIIADNFVGPLLGMLAGGAGGALEGQVKMLLDTNSGQLYTYSQDNPMDKRAHNVPGEVSQGTYQQAVGTVNVYGGPGSDPRDNTRDMMFQVRAAQQQGALSA